MNTTNLDISNLSHNSDSHYAKMAAHAMKATQPAKPRDNGTPEQFEALAEAFRRNGIHAEYNAELQANLNKKCLPNPSVLTNNFKVKEANNA